MIKETGRMKEHVRWNRLSKRWQATDKDYPMIRGYGISSANALSRLRLVVEETVKLMKGISP